MSNASYVFSIRGDLWQVRWLGQLMPDKFNCRNAALQYLHNLNNAELACLTGYKRDKTNEQPDPQNQIVAGVPDDGRATPCEKRNGCADN